MDSKLLKMQIKYTLYVINSCFFIKTNGHMIDKSQDTTEFVPWCYGSTDEICKQVDFVNVC